MFPLEHQALLQDQRQGQLLQTLARPKPQLCLDGIDFSHVVKPALYLSGDAVDYFRLPDGRILAYLLDVSGSGTAAALLCMLIKSMVRYTVAMREQLDAAVVLQDVNRMLLEAHIDKHATMLCMLVDTEHNRLHWASAGHTPRPFFYASGSVQALSSVQPAQPIGLFVDAQYQGQWLDLPSEFAFTVFSDGVLDCLPEASYSRRETQLSTLVQEARGGFSALYQRLALDARQQMPDDISMLVVSRNESA